MDCKAFALCTMLACLTACKIVIEVPENGSIETLSGAIDCDSGETCSVEVVDVFFDETFIAKPIQGYAFDGWRKAKRHFCGGSNSPCRLFTAFFEGNDALLDILQSNAEFYLTPQFRQTDTFSVRADMPVGGVARASCVVGGRLYVFGAGWETGETLDSTQRYNPISDRWSRRAPVPAERAWATSAALNRECYLIGGAEGSTVGGAEGLTVTSRVSIYSPAGNRWREGTPLPEALFSAGSAVADGKIYVAGGSSRFLSSVAPVTAGLWVYNPETNRWSSGAAMPTARRRLALNVIDGLIYASGGDLARNSPTDVVEVYDPSVDEWYSAASMPEPRTAHAASVFDGRLYVFGGFSAPPGLASTLVYDPARDQWRMQAEMHEARGDITAGTVGNRILILGGRDADHNGAPLFLTESYSP